MGFWVAERPMRNGFGYESRLAPGSRRVFAGDERVEALEAEGQVGAALVVGDGVDLVDDDGVDAAQVLAALLRGEQDVERLRGGDEDVGRRLQHGAALGAGVSPVRTAVRTGGQR